MSNADRVTGNWFAVNRSIMRNPLFAARATWGWAWIAILAATDYTTAEVILTDVYRQLEADFTNAQWRHMINVFKREEMLEVHASVNLGRGIGHRQTAKVLNWTKFQPDRADQKAHEDSGDNTEHVAVQHATNTMPARSKHGANNSTEITTEITRSKHGANSGALHRPARHNTDASTEQIPEITTEIARSKHGVLKEFKEFKERKEELSLPAFQESQDDKTEQLNLALTNPDSPEARAFLAAHGHSVDQRPAWNLKKQLLGILGDYDFGHAQIQEGLTRWARDHSAESVKAAWSKAVTRYQARYSGDTLRPMFYLIDILNFRYKAHADEPKEETLLHPPGTRVVKVRDAWERVRIVTGEHLGELQLDDGTVVGMGEVRIAEESEYATSN